MCLFKDIAGRVSGQRGAGMNQGWVGLKQMGQGWIYSNFFSKVFFNSSISSRHCYSFFASSDLIPKIHLVWTSSTASNKAAREKCEELRLDWVPVQKIPESILFAFK